MCFLTYSAVPSFRLSDMYDKTVWFRYPIMFVYDMLFYFPIRFRIRLHIGCVISFFPNCRFHLLILVLFLFFRNLLPFVDFYRSFFYAHTSPRSFCFCFVGCSVFEWTSIYHFPSIMFPAALLHSAQIHFSLSWPYFILLLPKYVASLGIPCWSMLFLLICIVFYCTFRFPRILFV